jgi:hypothetical protein
VLRATAHVEYEDSKRKKKRAAGSSAADAAAAAAAAAEADAAAAAAGGKALIVFTEMPYQVCKVGDRPLLPAHTYLLLFVHSRSMGVSAGPMTHTLPAAGLCLLQSDSVHVQRMARPTP